MVGWTRGKAVQLSCLNGSLICAVILSCSMDTTAHLWKLELLISRKVCQSAAKLIAKVNFLIAVLNIFFLMKPPSGLNLWSAKNVPRNQPNLMR